MTKLALSLPGFQNAVSSPAKTQYQDLGSLLSGGYSILLLIAAFLMVYWLSWGIFQYIFAGGEKEKLAHARKRITWAIVGFIIIVLAFTIRYFVEEVFPPQNTLTQVDTPLNYVSTDLQQPPTAVQQPQTGGTGGQAGTTHAAPVVVTNPGTLESLPHNTDGSPKISFSCSASPQTINYDDTLTVTTTNSHPQGINIFIDNNTQNAGSLSPITTQSTTNKNVYNIGFKAQLQYNPLYAPPYNHTLILVDNGNPAISESCTFNVSPQTSCLNGDKNEVSTFSINLPDFGNYNVTYSTLGTTTENAGRAAGVVTSFFTDKPSNLSNNPTLLNSLREAIYKRVEDQYVINVAAFLVRVNQNISRPLPAKGSVDEANAVAALKNLDFNHQDTKFTSLDQLTNIKSPNDILSLFSSECKFQEQGGTMPYYQCNPQTIGDYGDPGLSNRVNQTAQDVASRVFTLINSNPNDIIAALTPTANQPALFVGRPMSNIYESLITPNISDPNPNNANLALGNDLITQRGINPGPNLVDLYPKTVSQLQSCFITGVTLNSPSLFLYTQIPQSVKVTTQSQVGYSDPATNDNSWNVTTSPSGQVTTDNNIERDYLYYEYKRASVSFNQPNTGYIVTRSDWQNLIRNTIAKGLGLNQKETDRMISEVSNALVGSSNSPYLRISLIDQAELNSQLPLHFSTQPDHLYRFHLMVSSVQAPASIPEPTLKTVERLGFTAIELGAVYR